MSIVAITTAPSEVVLQSTRHVFKHLPSENRNLFVFLCQSRTQHKFLTRLIVSLKCLRQDAATRVIRDFFSKWQFVLGLVFTL